MSPRPGLPREVRVVGLPGSGKSTLALRLAAGLGVPVLDLDAVMRLPGGATATPTAFRAGVRAFLERSPDGWVVDGDDVDEVGLRYDEAALVVWLDVAPWRCRARVVWRGVVDLLTDARAWHGSREPWTLLVGRGPTAELVRWIRTEHAARTAFYERHLAAEPERWLRLRGPRDVAAFLRARGAPPREVPPSPGAGAGPGAPEAAGEQP